MIYGPGAWLFVNARSIFLNRILREFNKKYTAESGKHGLHMLLQSCHSNNSGNKGEHCTSVIEVFHHYCRLHCV